MTYQENTAQAEWERVSREMEDLAVHPPLARCGVTANHDPMNVAEWITLLSCIEFRLSGCLFGSPKRNVGTVAERPWCIVSCFLFRGSLPYSLGWVCRGSLFCCLDRGVCRNVSSGRSARGDEVYRGSLFCCSRGRGECGHSSSGRPARGELCGIVPRVTTTQRVKFETSLSSLRTRTRRFWRHICSAARG